MSYDKLSEKEKIIFLSGVFDGEGSFGVWSTGKKRPRTLRLKVETTDSDMVVRFQEMFGGSFFVTQARQAKWKHSFTWKIQGEQAWQVLKQMIPYMCLRRRQKYYGLVKPTGYGSEDWGSYLQKQTRIQEANVGCSKIARTENGGRGDRISSINKI